MLTLAAVWRCLPEARLVVAGQEASAADVPLSALSTDTRTLPPGALFVALRGPTHDGHTHAEAAQARGAAALLVDHVLPVALPQLVVADTWAALGRGAAAWRRQFSLPVIAVTGSNGKTSVTQMLAAILRNAYGDDALATQGNLNNDIGLPLMLWRLRRHHRAAVFELGTNHPGEIAPLAAMCRPKVALVNNAQREHQEFFASVEATATENGAAITALPADGAAVFPADDPCAPIWRRLAASRAAVDFALGAATPAAAVSAVVVPQLGAPGAHSGDGAAAVVGQRVQMRTPSGPIEVVLSVPGRHQAHNAVAATAAALAAGITPAAIVAGLSGFSAVAGRGVRHVVSQWLCVIDDTYNANPDSMRAAIELLAAEPLPAGGLRVLVAGDMGEVGEQSSAFHAEIGAWARARGVDLLLAHGPGMHAAVAAFLTPPMTPPMTPHMSPPMTPAALPAKAVSDARAVQFGHLPDLVAALRLALAASTAPVAVLVKGSRSMRMERVVAAIIAAPAASAAASALAAPTH